MRAEKGCNISHGAGVLDGIFAGDIQTHSERKGVIVILPIHYMFSLNFSLVFCCRRPGFGGFYGPSKSKILASLGHLHVLSAGVLVPLVSHLYCTTPAKPLPKMQVRSTCTFL